MTGEWKRAKFRIRLTNPEGWAEVDGVTSAACPHLGLHLSQSGLGVIDVTHIPTGRRIADFRTLGAAMEYVTEIIPLATWINIAPVTPEIEKTLRALAAKAYTSEFRPRVVKS
jgi:hypothetical protein